MQIGQIIYFDEVNSFGVTSDGIVYLTLTTEIPVAQPDGKTVSGIMPAANIRMGKRALFRLKEAVDKIALGLSPSGTRN